MKGVRCAKCKKFLTYEMLNDLESQELQEKGEFVCSDCINNEMNEEQDERDILATNSQIIALYDGGRW